MEIKLIFKSNGDEISLPARILAVAITVVSMASKPNDKVGMDAALKEIETGIDRLYDAKVVAACMRLFRQNGFSLP